MKDTMAIITDEVQHRNVAGGADELHKAPMILDCGV
jgi:hypothetical protein